MTTDADTDYCEHEWNTEICTIVRCVLCGVQHDDIPKVPSAQSNPDSRSSDVEPRPLAAMWMTRWREFLARPPKGGFPVYTLLQPEIKSVIDYIDARDEEVRRLNEENQRLEDRIAELAHPEYGENKRLTGEIRHLKYDNERIKLFNDDLLKDRERLREALDTRGIHTCSAICQRLPCVQRREIERLREALEWVREYVRRYVVIHASKTVGGHGLNLNGDDAETALIKKIDEALALKASKGDDNE
jgi:hypothetical protein